MTPKIPHGRPKELLIYGAGEHGRVVAEAAIAAGWRVIGFLTDDAVPGATVAGLPVLKPAEVFTMGGGPKRARTAPRHRTLKARTPVIVAIGNNESRRRVQRQLVAAGVALRCVVHPTAWVSPSARLGAGVFVGPMGVVNAQARLGDGVIVNSGGIVDHDSVIGDFAHVGPRAALAGGARVGALTLVGIGAYVRPGVSIGPRCTVGAGADVVGDVPGEATVVGIPARQRRAR